MSEVEGAKRFDRVVAILIQLQSKRIVKAQELADRFNVSLRTIYRDIKALEISGVPIYSEAGVGYSLMEGYRLAPVSFTQAEAASFVAAEKLMHKFTDATIRKDFDSALFKLRSVMRSTDKDWFSTIEQGVIINPSEQFNLDVPHALSSLFESIARRTQIHCIYETPGNAERTERTLETVGVFHQHNYWYVLAYCHLREAYRQFRIDRFQKIIQTDIKFSLQHKALNYYLAQNTKEALPTTRVVIEVNRSMCAYVNWERAYHGFIREEFVGHKVRMTFETTSLEQGFVRWYIMFADQARIIEPAQLKDRVEELLQLQLERLKN